MYLKVYETVTNLIIFVILTLKGDLSTKKKRRPLKFQ